MLKMVVSSEKLNSRQLRVGNSEVNRFCIGGDEKIAKKLEKLKDQNLSIPQKLAKSGKNLSKYENLSKFDIKNICLTFLTFKTKKYFNCYN